ncbi:D-hexose-6-phosphate mutarotase [Tatumella saanichensis]|uniref:D-hexose-6-phosphate mutarotase n=1 Tax=Tatumella saanichensis TaxID=480813 RepID=UPI0004A2C1ED|nr:D-hexose-6-phosphate mutarotase [Tatumella saanichensis]
MQDSLYKLPVTRQLSPCLSIRQKDELPLLVINHPRLRAVIALQGAQLISWQPAGQKPVIWLSDNSFFQNGTAIRGGVPVCWPWFGGQGKPSHGFARTLPWTLMAHDESPQGVMLTFELKSSPQTLRLWPHEFSLIARFRLGEHCEIELEAHGKHTSTGALHSYFEVEDIAGVSVNGLGSAYTDKVLNDALGELQGPQTYPGRVDRIFTDAANLNVIDDSVGQRHIEVSHQYKSDVVTWNPGPELSSSMEDMAANGYRTMVCVETARINRLLVSKAEAPAKMGVIIRVVAATA